MRTGSNRISKRGLRDMAFHSNAASKDASVIDRSYSSNIASPWRFESAVQFKFDRSRQLVCLTACLAEGSHIAIRQLHKVRTTGSRVAALMTWMIMRREMPD